MVDSVLVSKEALPGFWIFMYRVSPFNYLVSAVLSTGVARAKITCSDIELLNLSPPSGMNCSAFLGPYASYSGGQLLNPAATSGCQFCSMSTTDQYLSAVNIYFDDRWRDVGILFGYAGFNIVAAVFLYWLIRVPKKRSRKVKQA